MPVLRAEGLVKRFASTLAVDGVDLAVGEGEVRGLLGPNGAGKTTLLRLLLGLVRPDAGTVALAGVAVAPATPLGDGVAGFVEDPGFYPYLSARANLEVLAELDRDGATAKIDDVLGRVGLADRAGDRVSGFSSGMLRRLALASALMRSPRLLLLDEPTSGLDPAGIRFVGQLLRELADDGVAVLLSSHQIGEVEDACDTYTVINDGRVVWAGTAADMRSQAPPSTYLLHTSDDARARTIALAEGLGAEAVVDGGLELHAPQEAMDAYVLALAHADIAVRSLRTATSPLEAMFFALTQPGGSAPLTAPPTAAPAGAHE